MLTLAALETQSLNAISGSQIVTVQIAGINDLQAKSLARALKDTVNLPMAIENLLQDLALTVMKGVVNLQMAIENLLQDRGNLALTAMKETDNLLTAIKSLLQDLANPSLIDLRKVIIDLTVFLKRKRAAQAKHSG